MSTNDPADAFVELEGQASHADARRRRELLEEAASEDLLAELERRGLVTMEHVEVTNWRGDDLGKLVTAVELAEAPDAPGHRVGPPAPYTRPGNDQDPGPIGTALEGDLAHARTDRRHEGWAPRRLGMETPATVGSVEERLARLEALLEGDGR